MISYLGRTTSCTFQENWQWGTGVNLKARKYLMKGTLISLYYSFVYPYLICCNHVWGLACETYMNTLFLLQKRIIRIIAGVNRSHIDPIFKQVKLLKCNDINAYIIGRLMLRIYNILRKIRKFIDMVPDK